MVPHPASAKRNTANAILRLLKQTGPMDAAALARKFRISAMAVRQHLYAMQKAGLVAYEEHPRPVGRPAKLWRLTSRAEQFFPDAHAELTVDLIQLAGDAFGKAGIDTLVALRGKRQIEAYRQEIPERASIETRLNHLRDIREREGYMAEVRRQKDGTFLLIENHCPICAAAKACSGLCSAELDVFQKVIGERWQVERTEHILAGARRCVYRVRPR